MALAPSSVIDLLLVVSCALTLALAENVTLKRDESAAELEMTTMPTSRLNISTATGPPRSGDVIKNVSLLILIGLVSIVTVVGNMLVFMSVMIFRKLHSINNMFILSLAVADVIMGGFVMPLGAQTAIGGKWLLGSFMCDIWISVDVLSVTASIGTLCVISLDRYLAISKPFKYSLKMTRPRARLVIGVVWIISAIIAFIPVHLGWWKKRVEDDSEAVERETSCAEDPECCSFEPNQTYAVVSSLISFYIPLVVMLFAYGIVFKIAFNQRNMIRNREGVYRRASMPGKGKQLLWGRGEYRAIFTMGIIMGTFVACWLPFFIVNILSVFCKTCVPEPVFLVLNFLGYVNSFFNPIIYSHSKEFRRAFKRILLCGLCREGYRQTSRASLSVSYTPTASTRSSIFQLTSFFLSGGSSNRQRMSTSSAVSKRSPNSNAPSPANNNKNNNNHHQYCRRSHRPSVVSYRYPQEVEFLANSGTSGSEASIGATAQLLAVP